MNPSIIRQEGKYLIADVPGEVLGVAFDVVDPEAPEVGNESGAHWFDAGQEDHFKISGLNGEALNIDPTKDVHQLMFSFETNDPEMGTMQVTGTTYIQSPYDEGFAAHMKAGGASVWKRESVLVKPEEVDGDFLYNEASETVQV